MIKILDEGDYKTILVDEVPQSFIPNRPDVPVHTWGPWELLIPKTEPRNALILGFGGGTVATELLRRYPNVKITGVDVDDEMLAFAKKQFGDKVTLIKRDAWDYVQEDHSVYDYVLVDISNGNWIPYTWFAGVFFNFVLKLLSDRGELFFNAPNIEKIADHQDLDMKKTYYMDNIVFQYKYKK